MSLRQKNAVPKLPHSWGFEDWPDGVWPGKARARYVVRANRAELMRCGALSRPGRELVVLGAGYAYWLARASDRVEGFDIAPNRSAQDAAAA
jgi:hypothetical protein